jgi:hypothetical protein
MREIVRMTAQKQPLEVGVPLYPFSHTTLFRKDEVPPPTEESAGAAPLPGSPPFEQQTLPERVWTTWPRRDTSGSPANYVL